MHLSTTIFDVDTVPANSKKTTQLWVDFEGSDHLIAVVSRLIPQVSLDVGFAKDSKVTFFVKGEGEVHLNGYEGPKEIQYANKFLQQKSPISHILLHWF